MVILKQIIRDMKTKNLLIIFSKNQILGKVKTRLAKSIGEELALKTYGILAEHTASTVKNIACDKAIYFSEQISANPTWKSVDGKAYIQKGANLGEKMSNAFDQGFEDSYQKVILIGSDLFDLQPHHLKEAFQKLEQYDTVIGPAADGGYYLIGLKNNNPLLFKNKNWGTSSVLKDTLADLKDSNISLLEELNDIDIYSDLKGNEKLLKLVYNDTKVNGEHPVFAEQRI